ncbi:hypothetical protein P7K49_016323 [Saguinus oedipus]|uniref:Uncharacterized protein n=1 Tax=Saguinus oedipus TaxID=9490 RepID=A0ABQ9VD24_SAGOE|nr:hypothetical protein P7K49_016323 [Saguinus oedipus]
MELMASEENRRFGAAGGEAPSVHHLWLGLLELERERKLANWYRVGVWRARADSNLGMPSKFYVYRQGETEARLRPCLGRLKAHSLEDQDRAQPLLTYHFLVSPSSLFPALSSIHNGVAATSQQSQDQTPRQPQHQMTSREVNSSLGPQNNPQP